MSQTNMEDLLARVEALERRIRRGRIAVIATLGVLALVIAWGWIGRKSLPVPPIDTRRIKAETIEAREIVVGEGKSRMELSASSIALFDKYGAVVAGLTAVTLDESTVGGYPRHTVASLHLGLEGWVRMDANPRHGTTVTLGDPWGPEIRLSVDRDREKQERRASLFLRSGPKEKEREQSGELRFSPDGLVVGLTGGTHQVFRTDQSAVEVRDKDGKVLHSVP